jgi:hypothetical protein
VVLYRPALKIFETSLKYLSIFKNHPYRQASIHIEESYSNNPYIPYMVEYCTVSGNKIGHGTIDALVFVLEQSAKIYLERKRAPYFCGARY